MFQEHFLHDCVFCRNMSLLVILLEHNININLKDKQGRTPLHIAIRERYQEGTDVLLHAGVDVNIQDNYGNTPLHESIHSSHIVSALLDHGALPNVRNSDLETPLHLAVRERNKPVVELIISGGGDVNAKNKYENTPLHIAVVDGSYDIIKLLLDKGAEVNAESVMGLTALHIAAQMCELSILRLLLIAGANPNSLEISRYTEDLCESDISGCTQGKTALHYAAENGSLLCSRLLLESGVDPTIKDRFGETALHLMVINLQDIGTIELLIDSGGDVNARNGDGCTPLFNALSSGNKDIIQILLDSGAAVNIKDTSGNTPLHKAVECGLQFIKLLLKWGADVDATNVDGVTALQLAAVTGKINCVELLLGWGASGKNFKFGYVPEPYTDTVTCLFALHSLKLHCIRMMKKENFGTDGVYSSLTTYFEELNVMKKTYNGYHSIFDIFYKYNDPYFVTNSFLEKEILDHENKFPNYHTLLLATFFRAKNRFQMLNQVQEYFSINILPNEIKRKILTYFSDGDLKNVIKVVKCEENMYDNYDENN